MDENEDQQEPSEIMAEFLTQFIASGTADLLYRKHYCDIVVGKVYNEFGYDGLAEMMMSMDKKADWISDILIEAPDLDNIAFKVYGVFDDKLADKARQTDALREFNDKLWRLRRKYSKLIVAEIMEWDESPNDIPET
jgi:hypothetical protein